MEALFRTTMLCPHYVSTTSGPTVDSVSPTNQPNNSETSEEQSELLSVEEMLVS